MNAALPRLAWRWLASLAASARRRRCAARAPATAFPSRPITLWVPWAAGGATDITMRLLAELAGAASCGQRVLIENRGGAGGTLAMPILQQAEPDGYTIAQVPQPVFRAPFTQKVLWDPIRDITPIIQLSGVTFGVLVPAASALPHARRPVRLRTRAPGRTEHRHQRRGHHAARGARGAVHRARPEATSTCPTRAPPSRCWRWTPGQVMVGVNSTGFAPVVDSGRLRLLATFARAALQALAAGADAAGTRLRHRRHVALRPGRPARAAAAVVRCCTTPSRKAMFDPQFVPRDRPSTTRSSTTSARTSTAVAARGVRQGEARRRAHGVARAPG